MKAERGILAIWHDIQPDHTDEVLEWYNREHHFERLSVPGFRRVRRYVAVEGAPCLFINYETDDAAVLSSPAYLDRLNAPTPWTLQSQPHFRNNSRTVCNLVFSWGSAEGGYVSVLRMEAAGFAGGTGYDPEAIQAAVAEVSGVVGGEIWSADHDRSTIASREKEIRKGQDHHVDAVVVVHVTDLDAARRAAERLRAALPAALLERSTAGIWQLSFRAEARNLD